jgi:DNA (cytosine-5)-methyltransferase 1
MRFLDLFSGIGGFALGLERAGMQVTAFCEVDPFRQAVLRKHWPDVPVFGDIRKLTKEKLIEAGVIDDEINLVCGGFPCQPFSVAGKRRGKADDRYLWPEMLRVIREVKPRWVLGENVANMVSMALDTVLSDLESVGYSCQAFVIPACAVGAPHRRDRVWVVGYAEHNGLVTPKVARGSGETGHDDEKRQEKASQPARTGRPCSCEVVARKNVAYALCQGLQDGRCPELPEAEAEAGTGPERGLERCSGRQAQPGLGGVLDGLSSWLDGHRWPAPFGREQYAWEPPRLAQTKVPYRRQRLMALGDAVVPVLVEIIGRAILQSEH